MPCSLIESTQFDKSNRPLNDRAIKIEPYISSCDANVIWLLLLKLKVGLSSDIFLLPRRTKTKSACYSIFLDILILFVLVAFLFWLFFYFVRWKCNFLFEQNQKAFYFFGLRLSDTHSALEYTNSTLLHKLSSNHKRTCEKCISWMRGQHGCSTSQESLRTTT